MIDEKSYRQGFKAGVDAMQGRIVAFLVTKGVRMDIASQVLAMPMIETEVPKEEEGEGPRV